MPLRRQETSYAGLKAGISTLAWQVAHMIPSFMLKIKTWFRLDVLGSTFFVSFLFVFANGH